MTLGKLNEALGDLAKLTADTKSGRVGKGADAIAVGAAQPYKKGETTRGDIFSKQYPALGRLAAKVKESPMHGSVVITGAALAQLNRMLATLPLNKDEEGRIILPFGQNMRLTQRDGAYFMAMKKGKRNG